MQFDIAMKPWCLGEPEEFDPRVKPLTQLEYWQNMGSNTRLPNNAMRHLHAAGLPLLQSPLPTQVGHHYVSTPSQAALAGESPSSAKSSSTPFHPHRNKAWPAPHMPQETPYSLWGGEALDRVSAPAAADLAAPFLNASRALPFSTGMSYPETSMRRSAGMGFTPPLQLNFPLQPDTHMRPIDDWTFNQALAAVVGAAPLPRRNSLQRDSGRKPKVDSKRDVQPGSLQRLADDSRRKRMAGAMHDVQPNDDTRQPNQKKQKTSHTASPRAIQNAPAHAATTSPALRPTRPAKGPSRASAPAPAPAGEHRPDTHSTAPYATPGGGVSEVQAPQPLLSMQPLINEQYTRIAARVQPIRGALAYSQHQTAQTLNRQLHSAPAPAPAPSPPAAAPAQMAGYRVGQVVWGKTKGFAWWPAIVSRSSLLNLSAKHSNKCGLNLPDSTIPIKCTDL